MKGRVKGTVILTAGIAVLGIAALSAACTGSNAALQTSPAATQTQLPGSSDTTVATTPAGSLTTSPVLTEATVMISEIAGSNISFNSAAQPFVLKFDSSLIITRFDGSAGTVKDLRSGMTVKVFYDAASNILARIEVQ